MRTLPKSLSAFRDIVSQRGQQLRQLPYEELQRLRDAPIEHLKVESRPLTIRINVEQQASGGIRVVLEGFMKARLIPFSSHMALDGFYKFSDETLVATPLSKANFLLVADVLVGLPSLRCIGLTVLELQREIWRTRIMRVLVAFLVALVCLFAFALAWDAQLPLWVITINAGAYFAYRLLRSARVEERKRRQPVQLNTGRDDALLLLAALTVIGSVIGALLIAQFLKPLDVLVNTRAGVKATILLVALGVTYVFNRRRTPRP